MGTTAGKWEVQIESSVDGCGRFYALDCGELTNLNVQNRGLPARQFLRDHTTGKYTLIDQQLGIPSNSLLLTLTEEDSDVIRRMVRGNCVTALRRVNCDTGDVHHYCTVTYGSQNISQLTASGINATDNVPLVAVPLEYFGHTEFNEDMAFVESPVDTTVVAFNNVDRLTALAITGCGCQDCEDDCEIVYRLYYAENDTTTTDSFFYLERSFDGGKNWEQVVTQFFNGFGDDTDNTRIYDHYELDFAFMDCSSGKINIGFNFPDVGVTGGYRTFVWTKEHDCDKWSQTFGIVGGDDLGGYLTAHTGNNFNELFVRVVPLGGGAHETSILRNTVRNGNSQVVHTTTTGAYYAISSAGAVVVAGGDNGSGNGILSWSTESGAAGTWYVVQNSVTIDGEIISVDVYLPNPMKTREAVAVVATKTNKIYWIKLPKTNTNEEPCTVSGLIGDEPAGVSICNVLDFCELGSLPDTGNSGLVGYAVENETDLITMLDGRYVFWGRRSGSTLHYTNDAANCRSISTFDLLASDSTVVDQNNNKVYICKHNPSYAILAYSQ